MFSISTFIFFPPSNDGRESDVLDELLTFGYQ